MGGEILTRRNIGYDWRRSLAAVMVLVLCALAVAVLLGVAVSALSDRGAYQRSWRADLVAVTIGSSTGAPYDLFITDDAVHGALYVHPLVETVQLLPASPAVLRVSGHRAPLRVNAILTEADSLSAPSFLSNDALAKLDRNNTVFLSEADAASFGLTLGETFEDQSGSDLREMTVVAVAGGEMNTIGSLISVESVARRTPTVLAITAIIGAEAMQRLTREMQRNYTLLQIRDDVDLEAARRRLDQDFQAQGVQFLKPAEIGRQLSLDLLREHRSARNIMIGGLFGGMITLGVVVVVIRSAILSQRSQFAAMLALGVGRLRLIALALEYALWVGLIGVAFFLAAIAVAAWSLDVLHVGFHLPLLYLAPLVASILALALLGGLLALPAVLGVKPAELLR